MKVIVEVTSTYEFDLDLAPVMPIYEATGRVVKEQMKTKTLAVGGKRIKPAPVIVRVFDENGDYVTEA